MLDVTALYVVEWSPSGKQIHIERLESRLQQNIAIIGEYEERKFVPDYVLVGVTDSREEAMEMADMVEKEFKK